MIDAIFKFKPGFDDPSLARETLDLMADEANAVFGSGGNKDALNIEGVLGIINVPPSGGYVRVRIPETFGQALEYVAAHGGSAYAELVTVLWAGVEEPVLDLPEGEQLGVFS